MRLRIHPVAAGCVLSLAVLSLTGGMRAAEPSPDEELVRSAGVPIDGPGLLRCFEAHTGSDADLKRLPDLVRQLGSPSFQEREEASRRLAALGMVADAALCQAVHSSDPEVVARAAKCLDQIAGTANPWLAAAAARLLAQRRPDGALAVLLRYLPHAGDEGAQEAMWRALDALAATQTRLERAITAMLRDPLPLRRAAAGYLCGRRGGPAEQAGARKLLADPDPLVRLRVAQGLLGAGQTAAIPALIALLEHSPVPLAWQAEELLHWVAAGKAPAGTVGSGNEEARRRCREAWEGWWRTQHGRIDLRQAQRSGRLPGLLLVFLRVYPWNPLKTGIWLYGCDQEPRWHLDMDSFVQNMRLTPQGELILTEWSEELFKAAPRPPGPHAAVTWRDLEGRIHRRYSGMEGVLRLAPLPGGRALVMSQVHVTVINAREQQRAGPNLNQGNYGGMEMPQLLGNGRVLANCSLRGGQLMLVELDRSSGKVVRTVTMQGKINVPYGLDVLELSRGAYLVSRCIDRCVREVDSTGKVTWQSTPIPGAFDALRLSNGNTLIAAGNLLIELERSGQVVGERTVPGRTVHRLRACLPLVSLGLEALRPPKKRHP